MNQNIEIAFNFTREIPLKILPGFKILGEPGAEIVYLLLVGGWWLVGGWMCFFLHTPISELTVHPSYTQPKGLAPLGMNFDFIKKI